MIARRFLACCNHSNSAGPIDAIARRQLHVTRNALLRLFNRAREIAAPHTEFDRDEALVALAEDVGCARVEGYIGKFTQGKS